LFFFRPFLPSFPTRRSSDLHGLSPLVGHTPHPILARAHHRLAHSEGPCPPGLRALYSRATLGARGRRRVVPADLRRACHRRLSRSEEHTSELQVTLESRMPS